MTCGEAREAFSDLYDGSLSGARLVGLSRHLDGCPACRAEWSAFRKAMRAVANLGFDEPSPGFAARIRQEIEAPPWWLRLARSLFVPFRLKLPLHAAALLLLSFAGVLVYQRSTEIQPEAVFRARPPSAVPPAPAAPPAPPRREALEWQAKEPESPAGPPPPAPESRLQAAKEQAPSLRREEPAEPTVAAPAERVGRAVEPSLEPPAKPSGSRETARDRLQAAPAPEQSPAARGLPREAAPTAPTRQEAPPGLPAGSVDDLFSSGMTAYVRGDYDRASDEFRAFLAQAPHDRRAPDARFFLADSYLAGERYREAAAEFEAFQRDYPQNRRIPSAQFRQGRARLGLGDRAGCQELRSALERYPRSRDAAAAKESLAAHCP